MKIRICWITILLVTLQCQLYAQQFRAGLTGGLVASDIKGTDTHDFDNDFYKAGFIFGGFVNAPLKEQNSFQLELNYIQKGTEQHADSTGTGYYKFSFDYLEFPLIYKYRLHFKTSKKALQGFGLHAGISVGRIIKSDYSSDDNGMLDMSQVNKTDVSLLAGLDYYFSPRFNFSFRYSNSVIPVIKYDAAPRGYYSSAFNYNNNMVLHFMFQYMFGKVEKTAPKTNDNSDD